MLAPTVQFGKSTAHISEASSCDVAGSTGSIAFTLPHGEGQRSVHGMLAEGQARSMHCARALRHKKAEAAALTTALNL